MEYLAYLYFKYAYCAYQKSLWTVEGRTTPTNGGPALRPAKNEDDRDDYRGK